MSSVIKKLTEHKAESCAKSLAIIVLLVLRINFKNEFKFLIVDDCIAAVRKIFF